MPEIPNSLFLDLTSYGTTTYTAATRVVDAYHVAAHPASETVNVALILPRANDPTALLASNWATRQTTLAELNANGTLWSTYGASRSDYDATVARLTGTGPDQLGLKMIGDASGSDGYISSPESRTIWLQLSPADFDALFGTPAFQSGPLIDNGLYFWNGNLSLPDGLNVAGLWFDFMMRGPNPAVSDLSGGASADIAPGWQSIGNALGAQHSTNLPGDIARWFYNFPLTGIDTPTATVGIIEPGSGDVLPASPPSFQHLLEHYRHNAGLPPSATYYSIANNGTNYDRSDPGERSLDVGVVASASPGSTIGLYAGSGFYTGAASGPGSTEGAYSNVFTSFQAAFWDLVNEPPVISASYSMTQQTRPGSLFATAAQELFIDAALRNITLAKADNDFGSSWGFANGLANQNVNVSSPYIVVVGGTSLTTLAAALSDPTEASLHASAMADDLATLWQLVAGGLTVLPSAASGAEAAEGTFLEAVWNKYALWGTSWTGGGAGAGDGGVDTTQATPWYQTAFGLTPTSVNPSGGTGRGAPDVAADSGGNMSYLVPGPDMAKLQADDGTSAAAPLWAALIAQIDTIFQDQGLPNLGYMNDLLYIAAAIAPPSFNDITFGNNVSSYYRDPGAELIDANGAHVALTGFGYHAGPGYDLTTGLGTPNGTLLARALSSIAHSQMWFADSPDLMNADGNGGWTSGADQSLLFQTMSSAVSQVGITTGPDAFGFFGTASDSFAWTNRLAQQSLQPDFDPRLVILFDKQAQGSVAQSSMHAGDGLAVSIDGTSAQAIQGTLSSPFGFANFLSTDGAVRVARPVAVAETAGGLDDQVAVVRLRQNGEDDLSLTFYRVDDLNGTINGLHPGDPGYAAALQARAYQLKTGGTSIDGPGYGNYEQTGLLHVNANDLVAMQLTNHTAGTTYSAFAQANETVAGQHVGHLWNYGLNTWGWEDLPGGGDRDFNDLVVGLDFTSAAGHGWLV